MKILHLLSNWKWTERSEPAAELALAQQVLGHDVIFACDHASESNEDAVVFRARQKGLQDVRMLSMPKHFRLLSFKNQAGELRQLVDDLEPQILHTHMPHASLLARHVRKVRPGFRLVQHCYDPEGPIVRFRDRFLPGHPVDGLVVMSEHAKRNAAEKLGFDEQKIAVVEPAVDIDRFAPGAEGPADRRSFGLGPDAFVVGIVSRIRRSRRLDIPLEAVARLASEFPRCRLLVVGRGSGDAVADVVTGPANRLGIAGRVILAGYCRGPRLVSAYRAMDVLVYPSHGTDKSCRTVREALAAGVPVIGARTGFVPSLVRDGENGQLMDASAESCERALRDLMRNMERLIMMRKHARTSAVDRFSPETMGRAMDDFYNVISGRKGIV